MDVTETALDMAAAEVRTGLRERNKAAKLQRIRKAARALFVKRGYDDATMREIARRANVGFGTLFTYASDKRDLLFLIFNDELDAVVDAALERATTEETFIDRLVAYFSAFYAFFAPQPKLSRIVLREMTFYTEGLQAERFQQSCGRMKDHLSSFFVGARDGHHLASKESPEIIADALMYTFASEIRHWIAADGPMLSDGLARLRRMLTLQVVGLEPRKGTLSKQ